MSLAAFFLQQRLRHAIWWTSLKCFYFIISKVPTFSLCSEERWVYGLIWIKCSWNSLNYGRFFKKLCHYLYLPGHFSNSTYHWWAEKKNQRGKWLGVPRQTVPSAFLCHGASSKRCGSRNESLCLFLIYLNLLYKPFLKHPNWCYSATRTIMWGSSLHSS